MSSAPQIDLQAGPLTMALDLGMDALFQAGASDVTIQTGDFVWAYIARKHVRVTARRLDAAEIGAYVRHLYKSDAGMGILGAGNALDFDVDLRPYTDNHPGKRFDPDYSVRCRVNATACRVADVSDAISITLRTIPGLPPEFDSLGLPANIKENFFPSQGLVLIVGITGSGKSTLLAAGNRHRLTNAEHPVKILTAEDPIEFVYGRLPSKGLASVPGAPDSRMPEVSQVQLGRHLSKFDQVAPNVLRRKADVVVMGEMRDRESVATGLLLAQTGHCTYATLHCETPAEAVARVVAEFPEGEQPAAANKLLDSLRLIVAQKIERDIQGKGRAFRSWCVFDRALKNALSSRHFSEWSAIVRKHMESLGHTFEAQALQPCLNGEISKEVFARLAGFNNDEADAYLLPHVLAAESRVAGQGRASAPGEAQDTPKEAALV